ncbi:8577_t:CDS:2 [Acaulospora morrowiae]|uniref:Autophagy-related protein 14 n=1 Tax=Acaulospora morrowiae TaxID=94023 RepID=A0A9N9CBA5_9GLOM|nr:8577_t:CDS:2 [Acaulospora morrowiae]
MKQITQEKQRNVEKANKYLVGTLRNFQVNLADKHSKAQKLSSLEKEINRTKEEIGRDRQEIDILKRNLRTRRQVLQESLAYFKKFKSHQEALVVKDMENTKERWCHVHQVLTHSRKVLIAELVSLFDLKRISDPSSHNNAPKDGKVIDDDGEYAIAGMTLPKKADFVRYSHENINAAVGHVIHMLGLVAHYLGVKLPFMVVNRGSKSYTKGSVPGIPISKMPLVLNDRNLERFTVGMAMLNYDIAYLCHTQGVEIASHKVPHTLQNLYLCCQAPNLGRSGHLTALNRIFDQSFSLDFEEVLRMMFALRNGTETKDGIIDKNIPGVSISDYIEEDFEDDNDEDGDNWVICDGTTYNPSCSSTQF